MDLCRLVAVAAPAAALPVPRCHPWLGSAPVETLRMAKTILFPTTTAAEKRYVNVVSVTATKGKNLSTIPAKIMISTGAWARQVSSTTPP